MRKPTTELKVMSFNIRYGTANDGENSWPYRREAVIEFLKTSEYDVIGLQEALHDQLTDIRRELPYLHWVGVGRDDGLSEGEYSAILYDSRRVDVEVSDTFWFSNSPDVPSTSWGNTNLRACTHGRFVFGEHSFVVYNLHIDHESQFSRQKSLEMLLARIAAAAHDVPVIVTGDFNEGECGPSLRLMFSAGFQDTYRAVNPDGPEQATFHDWKPLTTGQKIDYIFAGSDLKVLDASIIRETPFRRFLSDHYPVVARLEI